MKAGLIRGDDGETRCWWPGSDPDYVAYHDDEWGRPVTDDRRLFEKLCLEGFQSGLSWLTILRKRENFRRAFRDFDFVEIARFKGRNVERLLADSGIVRHRGKIEATINNAKRCCELVEQEGSLAAFVWRYAAEPRSRPKRMTHAVLRERSTSAESIAMSKELKRLGWSFVGPTTAYAFQQAMGLVNDHLDGCFVRDQVEHQRTARAALPRKTAP